MVNHPLRYYDFLSPKQSGFLPGHSTQDVLLCVTDLWLKAIDDDKYVGATFLDLVKAFDCVSHEILLTCHMVSGEMLSRLYSRPNTIFNPCMLMIFLLPLLMLMSIFMLMIQNYIFVITNQTIGVVTQLFT